MKKALLVVASLWCASAWAEQAAPEPEPTSYGDAVVLAVVRLDETVTLYCDIEGFPAVIGKNMPVRIKSLKTAGTPEQNLKLLVFLNELLFSKDKPVKSILLKDMERGKPFCLMADIEVDGEDLCDLLVEQKLARKIVEVGGSETTPNVVAVSAVSEAAPAAAESAAAVTYVCSKSSKVFHRSTCSHAKRMDMAKAITFATSQEAAATGRRPCKTCNP